jgi:glycine/D-amino acid oxidase-like deaminating enzyme
MSNEYDAIVIGGGPLGLAAAYHLSQREAKTLVLERFRCINQQGSSAGVTRQFRIPYPVEYMVKMAVQAQPFWAEFQTKTPVSLLDKVGTLWFGDPAVHSTEGNIAEAEKALNAAKVPYAILKAKDIEQTYHFRNLPDTYVGLFQADGASINLRVTQQTLVDWCRKSPHVTLKEEAPAIGIQQRADLFEVRTPGGTYIGKKLIIVPGPFINNVINLLGFRVAATYWNMASAYYRKTDPSIQYPTWFVFQNPVGQNGNQFYGFPGVDWDSPGYIRVASDFVIDPLTSPDQASPIPNPLELAFTAAWVSDHMTGLDPVPHFTSTCLVGLSTIPNKELLLDFAPVFVPNRDNVIVCATGWAAKFTPLIGRILSDLALDGTTPFDIAPFQLGPKHFSAC